MMNILDKVPTSDPEETDHTDNNDYWEEAQYRARNYRALRDAGNARGGHFGRRVFSGSSDIGTPSPKKKRKTLQYTRQDDLGEDYHMQLYRSKSQEKEVPPTSSPFVRPVPERTGGSSYLHHQPITPIRVSNKEQSPSPTRTSSLDRSNGSDEEDFLSLGGAQPREDHDFSFNPRTSPPPTSSQSGDVSLLLFTPERRRGTSVTSLNGPSSPPKTPGKNNRQESSSPLTPVNSPPPRLSQYTSPSPPAVIIRNELPEEFINQNPDPPRYPLRTRRLQQLRPYRVDKARYRNALNNCPEAIVNVVSPRRRRREDRYSSDGEVDPADMEEDDDEEQRRRRIINDSGERRQRQPIPAMRQDPHTSPPQHSSKTYDWFKARYDDLSDDEGISAMSLDALHLQGKEHATTEGEKTKKRRLKPFPMKRTQTIDQHQDNSQLKAGPSKRKDTAILIDSSPSPPGFMDHTVPSSDTEERASPRRSRSIHLSRVFMSSPEPDGFPPPQSFLHFDEPGPPTSSDPFELHRFRSPSSVIDISSSPLAPSHHHHSSSSSESDGEDDDVTLLNPKTLDKKGRDRLRALRRMMPTVMIKEKLAELNSKRRSDSKRNLRDDDDDDTPLLPGQSRVRRGYAGLSREVKGDEESDSEVLRSPSSDNDDQPSGTRESIRNRRTSLPPISISDSEEDGDNDDDPEEEPNEEEMFTQWVTRKSGQSRVVRRWNGDEAEERDLIDFMLSRTNITSGKKKRQRKGSSKKTHLGRKHPTHSSVRTSNPKTHVMVQGSRQHGIERQTTLPFAPKQQHERSTFSKSKSSSGLRLGLQRNRSLSTSLLENEVIDVDDDDEPDHHRDSITRDVDETYTSPHEQHVEPDAHSILLQKRKERKKKAAQGKVYVFSAKGDHIVTGRAHPTVTAMEIEDEDFAPQTKFNFVRPKNNQPRKRLNQPLRPRGLNERRLDDFWPDERQLPNDDPITPHIGTKEVQEQTKGKYLSVDLDISLFPSGIRFSSGTYIGSGSLAELLSMRAAANTAEDVPRPALFCPFGSYLSASDPIPVFLNSFTKITQKLQSVLVSSASPLESLTEWAKAFRSICQHVTWFLVNSDPDGITTIKETVNEFLTELAHTVENRYAVRADIDPMNMMAFEAQWFGVELAWRTFSNLEPLLVQTKHLLRHLWAFGLGRPLDSISSIEGEGLTSSEPSQRIAEIWVCLIRVTQAWSSLWDQLRDVLSNKSSQHVHQSEIEASETLWRGIYGLCALSQFSVHGLTTSTVETRLPASWSFVAFALQRIRLTAYTEKDAHLNKYHLLKRDKYIRLLISRCMALSQKWKWKLDDGSLMFHALLSVFKSRQFADLADEKPDFPSFLRDNDMELLLEPKKSDTAFALFLKLITRAVKVSENSEHQDDEQKKRVKQILFLAVPVASLPFTKDFSPTSQDLSRLYNRFSAVALAIYLEPSPTNVKYLLTKARRYVNFANTGTKTRTTCIRGLMHLVILLYKLHLPLNEILEWPVEMMNVLIDEYRSLQPPSTQNSTPNKVQCEIVVCIQLLLGCLRNIISSCSALSRNSNENQYSRYPDPALLQGPWITRLFAQNDLTLIPTTGREMRRLVQAFLDARSSALPPPPRPRRPPTASNEDSQESQDYFADDNINYDDPELNKALGVGVDSFETDDLKGKEEIVAQIMNTYVATAIYRLICKHFQDSKNYTVSLDEQLNIADRWVDCWVGCADVIVRNGLRDWSTYLNIGPQSWACIINPTWRRRVGLRFMFKLLQLDPMTYQTEQDRFLELFLVSLVTMKVTIEHEYVALVLSNDGLQHEFLQGLPCHRDNPTEDFNFTKPYFLENRMAWIEYIFQKLNESLGNFRILADERRLNETWIGFVISMLSAMQDTYQNLTPSSLELTAYKQFRHGISQVLRRYDGLHSHSRLQTYLRWIDNLDELNP
ncbi:Mus7/MMS22 family-domain-containing protein [Abortiporus biennis]|nr:Mus7/MMS22 family-domain-containing protein [Abortiporus biennis]